MPLGGIDTGALYLEPSGQLGYTSIFNHLTPVGGPLNTPYLGVAMGGKGYVCGTGQTKNYAGNNRPSFGIGVAGGMQESEYWGHYPIADVEYKTDAPVQIGVRSWSPFIIGDSQASNTPGAVFEVHLRNKGTTGAKGCVVFSFPGFAEHHTRDRLIGWPNLAAEPVMPPTSNLIRRLAPKGLRGVWVEDIFKAWGMSYVLATTDEGEVRTGGALGVDGAVWEKAEERLPSTAVNDNGGSSLTVDFNMGPGEQKVVRIILAWYAPDWEGNGVPGTGGERIWTYAPEGMALSTTGKLYLRTCCEAASPMPAKLPPTWGAITNNCWKELSAGSRKYTQTRRCPAGWRIRLSTPSIISPRAACGRKQKIPLEAGASRRTACSLWRRRHARALT